MKRISCWFSSCRTVAAVALWFGSLAVGFGVFEAYKGAAGDQGSAPADISSIPAQGGSPRQARLLMFVHPHCPCTKASLAELHKAMAGSREPAVVEVVLVKPAGVGADWEQGVSAKAASAIPGIHIRCDDGGLLARQYGASTSGHVVFYDHHGKLQFSGGVTRLRGHEGDNMGADAITSLLSGLPTSISTTPVYGCPLIRACERHVTGSICGPKLEESVLP